MNKIAILLVSLILVACASPTPVPAPMPRQSDKQTNSSASQPASASTVVASQTTSVESSNDSGAMASSNAPVAASTAAPPAEKPKIVNESIYFDFDEFAVKPEFRETVEAQASSIVNKKSSVVLEGNADERGSAAFNLALGEKRSTSVKRVLVGLGVPVSNIKVVSYGKARPKLDCHEEKCWYENRRVDFVIK